MYIEIKEIGPDGLVVDRNFSCTLPPLPDGADQVTVGPVHLSGELHKDGAEVAFSGDITTVATLQCSRCLEPYPLALDLHFDLKYTTEPEAVAAGESRVDEHSITVVHFDGARIGLDDLLSEQILLGLPLKPLCRQDCGGLCPHCGTNRNLESCGCSTVRGADPRLASLKKLL
jgi:uncharacterized protein